MEREYDLFWYAFNYRNASTNDAEVWWEELQKCVNRFVERGIDHDDEIDAAMKNGENSGTR